jgi:DNA-binding winged helix-turn-helix (wHTH) protein
VVQQLRRELSMPSVQEIGLGFLPADPTHAPIPVPSARCECDRIRFGPYEADLRTHELWKHGAKVKLIGQPFTILETLLQRPGHLITRDELRSRLWPGDTFVDFDHGLNAAVNKLREALSDSVSNPKYIETLPRRGYRFLAKVEALPIASVSPSSAGLSRVNLSGALRGRAVVPEESGQ